ncbi:hypothetical protein [Ferrimonas pelagia]|uniref:Uncharacterized protein n=1 Tax=Ferrimonas pelagia TaxID=1177826 RepID=A0ABP9EH38_9GAMM
MELESVWRLLPVVITIGMALVVRRILPALGLGILSSALILNQGAVWPSLQYLADNLSSQFYQQGQWQRWHLDVLAAITLLGCITSLLRRSGAVTQFAGWLSGRIQRAQCPSGGGRRRVSGVY